MEISTDSSILQNNKTGGMFVVNFLNENTNRR